MHVNSKEHYVDGIHEKLEQFCRGKIISSPSREIKLQRRSIVI